jgi:hypothetical protein
MPRSIQAVAFATFVATAGPALGQGVPVAAGKVSELVANVVGGPWSSVRGAEGSCPTVYMLTWRNCPHCRAFFKEQFIPLHTQGYDIRIHYAPVDGEDQDRMAELAYRRDIRLTLLHQAGRMPPAPSWRSGPAARQTAYVGMFDAMLTMRGLSRAAGFTAFLPTFLWQDRAGRWRVQSGYSAGIAAAIRTSLPPPTAECANAATA